MTSHDQAPSGHLNSTNSGRSEHPLNRRQLLGGLGAGVLFGASGCLSKPLIDDSSIIGGGVDRLQGSVSGLVRSLDGSPIADATVTAVHVDEQPLQETTTDDRGRFVFDATAPAWLRIGAPGYLTRTVAVGTDATVTVRMTPDTDGVSLLFGGDAMFGRRFYGTKTDALSSRFQLASTPDERLDSHRELLRSLRPLFSSADVTSVNLETPLTTTEWRHPTKQYTFTSHPVAAQALRDAGVDYVSLGNNHAFDALRPGFEETATSLETAGINHSGAGTSPDEAWAPAYVERNGVTIAYLSCCTVVGADLDIDWSADRNPTDQYTIRQNGSVLRMSGGVGVAEPTVDRLQKRVKQAAATADVVVVQIHGGDEYVRVPIDRIERLTTAASDAGADIVANHHPHVTGGLEYRNSTLIAWTLGNIVFEQELWPTLHSYALSVDVGSSGIKRASIVPIVHDEYVPKGATGAAKESILTETAGLSSDQFSLGETTLELLPKALDGTDESSSTPSPSSNSTSSSHAANTEIRQFEAKTAVYARSSGWPAAVTNVRGTIQLGRNRLLTGDFEHTMIDGQDAAGALWRYGRGSTPTIRRAAGVDGSGGVRLSRHGGNVDDDVLTPLHRLPINTTAQTLSLRYHTSDTAEASLLVGWYNDAKGGSFATDRYQLPPTGGQWQLFARHLEAPPSATHANFFVFLTPPDRQAVSELLIDDVRFIEWSPNATSGRQYDHLFVDGSADVKFATDDGSTIAWSQLR